MTGLGSMPGGMGDLRGEDAWIEARLAGLYLAAAAWDWAAERTPVAYEAGMGEVVDALDRLGRVLGEHVQTDMDDPADLRRSYETLVAGLSYDLASGWVEDVDAAFGWAIRWAGEHGTPAEWRAAVGKIVNILDGLPEADQELGLHEAALALVLRVDAPPVSGAGDAMPRCIQRSWELLAGLGQMLPQPLVDRLDAARSGVERRVMGRPL